MKSFYKEEDGQKKKKNKLFEWEILFIQNIIKEVLWENALFFFFLFFKESSESVNHIINVQGTILQSHNNILGVL